MVDDLTIKRAIDRRLTLSPNTSPYERVSKELNIEISVIQRVAIDLIKDYKKKLGALT